MKFAKSLENTFFKKDAQLLNEMASCLICKKYHFEKGNACRQENFASWKSERNEHIMEQGTVSFKCFLPAAFWTICYCLSSFFLNGFEAELLSLLDTNQVRSAVPISPLSTSQPQICSLSKLPPSRYFLLATSS